MPILLADTGSAVTELITALPLLAVAVGYSVRTRTLAGRGTPVAVWRIAVFGLGLAIFAAAVLSPIDALATELVYAHMIQHVAILDIAALLCVLGLTGPLMQPLLAIRALSWIRLLGHPGVALPLWIANLYVWHVPALYQATTFDSGALHALEHGSFFFFGSMMWLSLLGPLPRPQWFGKGWALVYVGVVRLAGAALGNVLMWSGTVLYPRYGPSESERGISALSDQGTAGVIMMAESTVIVVATMVWLFFRWAIEDTERQRLIDLAESEGVALDPARAARAAAAGQGKRLEERLRAGQET